jgi:electron transfer flavoprotein beta subunit
MANVRTLMPALQRAKAAPLAADNLAYQSAAVPKQQRDTRIVKNVSAEEIARELAAWIRG